MTIVGNDVVDLRDPRCRGKAEDRRFVARIFSDAEASEIGAALRPDRALWLRWAAKEAAYKTVSKLLGSPPVFEHRAFRVRLDSRGQEGEPPAGTVRYREVEIPFDGEAGPDRIHLVAWHVPGGGEPAPIRRGVREVEDEEGDPGRRWQDALRDRFTSAEWSSVHGRPSALVRIMAKSELAETLGAEEGALEIVCPPGPSGRVPPSLRVDGRPWTGDLSLSHHGRLVAWAFTLVGEQGDGPGSGPRGSS